MKRRLLLWATLVLLLGVAQSLLVALTVRYESLRAQDDAEAAAAESAADVRRELLRTQQSVQALPASADGWRGDAVALLRTRRDLLRLELRGPRMAIETAVDSPFGTPLFSLMARASLELDTELACAAALRASAPMVSRSYFVPLPDGLGSEVVDLCLPLRDAGREAGFAVASYSLNMLLDATLSPQQARLHELSFVEADGTRLARAGLVRGAGVYVAQRLLDLPGATLLLRADAAAGHPSLIPNLATALVLGLSIALFAVVLLLLRDVRRRARAERALADALALRRAMENSVITGLRARDMDGRILYVNPAFCAMVGFSADELAGSAHPAHPVYWPPEHAAAYAERQRTRAPGQSRPGFETLFMKKGGERFPVMVYEAPLIDAHGVQSGWMSAVLDVTEQRRIEELSRAQQERLHASARLATVGEMASLVSHELNQPLAAIASYASGSLNMLADGDADTLPLLTEALGRIAEQVERAGRIIKSIHHVVRRREQQRETVGADLLIDAVLPLVLLQARKSGTRVAIDVPRPAPRVVCDRTMAEQALLNLTRNAIQAMETDATPLPDRVLQVRVTQPHAGWVGFAVADAGPGIGADVAAQLFTPFFTTRSEGMGLGLSLCRTVIEQHGGALDFGPGAGGRGTEFRFTLPAPDPARPGRAAQPVQPAAAVSPPQAGA